MRIGLMRVCALAVRRWDGDSCLGLHSEVYRFYVVLLFGAPRLEVEYVGR